MVIPNDDGRLRYSIIFMFVFVCICLSLGLELRLRCSRGCSAVLMRTACVCVWVPSENQMKVITSDQQMRLVQ